jgi:8-oxo-dGTP pyrophosphatase MutT (NUDIX family)
MMHTSVFCVLCSLFNEPFIQGTLKVNHHFTKLRRRSRVKYQNPSAEAILESTGSSVAMSETASKICRSYEKATEFQSSKQLKGSAYCTVVYLPPPSQLEIDFKVEPWPPVHDKQQVCPRILLVSTWTDAKFGFPGGGIKRSESPVDAIRREFAEELGSEIDFSESDFVFADIGDRVSYMFARVTSDEAYFNSLLVNFHTTVRKAYVNEIIAVAGYPIWLEGPSTVDEVCWETNVWGIARHLTAKGGFLTPTLGNTNIPRKHFLLLLLELRIVSRDLMARIFELCNHFNGESDNRPMESFASFLKSVNYPAI